MTTDSKSASLCRLVVDRNGGEGSLGAVSSSQDLDCLGSRRSEDVRGLITPRTALLPCGLI